MGDGIHERFRRLSGQRPSAGVGDRAGDHHRKAHAALVEHRFGREDRGLAVENVEDGLDQQQVDATVDQPRSGLAIGVGKGVEIGVPEPGVVDIGRDGGGAVGGAENACDEARALGSPRGLGVGGLPRDPGGGKVQVVDRVLHQVVRHRDGG